MQLCETIEGKKHSPPSSPPTLVTKVPDVMRVAPAAEDMSQPPAKRRKKANMKKSGGYAALMASITAPGSKSPLLEEEAHKQELHHRGLGGGAFTKIEKI